MRETLEEGGVRRRMSDPAALHYHRCMISLGECEFCGVVRMNDGRVSDLNRKTPWDAEVFVAGSNRCSR